MEKIIIPFGEECYNCQSLDAKFSKNNLRKCAFPFDYVGHTYVENIHNNIFDLINTNDYNLSANDFILKQFNDNNDNNDKFYMTHKKYEFKYWHDICNDDYITSPDVLQFVDKYNRRYARLKYYLNSNNYNIIILTVNHFDNIYTKKNKTHAIYELFNLLKSYNNNIKLIAVNFGEDIYNSNGLQFINLSVNFKLDFFESKQEFTKKLNNFVESAF